MFVLHDNGNKDLVPLSTRKFIIGCRWIFTFKVSFNWNIDRVKVHLGFKDLDWTMVAPFLLSLW